VPNAGENSSIAKRAATDHRGIALVAGIASMLVIVLILISVLGAGWLASLAWPVIPCTIGLVLIWRNAPADEQVLIRQQAAPVTGLAEGGKPRRKMRFIVTAVLLLAGIALLTTTHRRTSPVIDPVGGVVLVIAGFVVLLGPWWLRIARDLALERQARIRAEERADIAARVHDSVLQTLAMIQRAADEPQRVVQLARAQERELRAWLFDGRPPGSIADEAPTLAAGIRRIQQEVEARYEVAVEIVTVGDCGLDDDLAALLAAAREATVNAAKWSGARVISLFAEVSETHVALFVRDRGRGFDPAAVPADRKGVAESIRARMERRGGEATIRSAEGAGTEVTLTMPRAAQQREPSRI
jgi:signal transduction histidine kinase